MLDVGLQAARILANLIVMGSGIMIRAFAQAYRQALANASKTGAAHEAVQTMKRGSKMMTESEARQILGVTEDTPWEEIVKFESSFGMTLKISLNFLRGMTSCLRGILRVAVSISNRRLLERKNVWKVLRNQSRGSSRTRVKALLPGS
ncbi:hypothetical protein SASPL_117297 [Salvia splendens]|uniref:Mitochondrial import inner membrane translocase subunit TIM16 n=1 Tax=Salvia splendens TaxID=180675 RepID=A0A8X8XXP1_SALSN|nr:hypothetical protein SASPL_117297 [Salvia splendens]